MKRRIYKKEKTGFCFRLLCRNALRRITNSSVLYSTEGPNSVRKMKNIFIVPHTYIHTYVYAKHERFENNARKLITKASTIISELQTLNTKPTQFRHELQIAKGASEIQMPVKSSICNRMRVRRA